MHLLAIVSIIALIIGAIKDAFSPTLTAEHWANKELQHKDRMSGMSSKEILKNAERGRYYIPKEIAQAYPIPHREPDGNKRIIIENCELHREDVRLYGAYQAQQWVQQGKYNLNTTELQITHLQYEKKNLEMYRLATSLSDKEQARLDEIKRLLAATPWDCRKTEAVVRWEKAKKADDLYRTKN